MEDSSDVSEDVEDKRRKITWKPGIIIMKARSGKEEKRDKTSIEKKTSYHRIDMRGN